MKRSTINILREIALCAGICCLHPSCDKSPSGESQRDVFILSAVQDNQETRTALGAPSGTPAVYQVLWKAGDRISVNGLLSDPVADGDDGKKGVDFTVPGSPSAPFKVLYPGTSEERTISLPATQNYVAGSFDGAAAASFGNAVSNGDTYSVQLTPFCGVVRFALKGTATLDRIELNSLGEECLYGDFDLTVGPGGFTGTFNGGTEGALTYNCPVTLTGSDTYFYIAIPAQAYDHGLEALVYQADGAFMRLKFWGSGHTLGNRDLVEFESKTYAAGRTENLFGIDALIAEEGGEPTSARPGVIVATYNLKQQSNRTGGTYSEYVSMDREDVKTCMGYTIAALGADIIGFGGYDEDYMPSEAYDIQAMAEAGGMSSNYEWHLDYPNAYKRELSWTGWEYSADLNNANGFAFNTSTLTLVNDGYVWISQTENDYWSSAENAYDNAAGSHTVVWAKFTHKLSGKQFYFFVTAFAPYIDKGESDQKKNTNNTKSLETFVKDKERRGDFDSNLPIICVGNLNYGPVEKADPHDAVENYSTLTSYWTDAWAKLNADGLLPSFYQTHEGTLNGSSFNYYYPWNSFTRNHPWHRLDYVLTRDGSSHGVTPSSYKTIRQTYVAEDELDDEGEPMGRSRCPSDHMPVIVRVDFD